MKTIKLLFTFFAFVSFSNNLSAQSSLGEAPTVTLPNIAIVLSRSSQCAICKANETRVTKEFLNKLSKTDTKFFINDLTKKDLNSATIEIFKKLEINDLINKKDTGLIYFINLDEKKKISTISLSKSTNEIMEAYEMAKKG